MNILFIAERMIMGGAEKHTIRKIEYLKNKGHHCCVMSCGGDLVKELSEMGIEHFYMKADISNPSSMNLVNLMSDLENLNQIINRYDINLLNCMPTMPFYYAYITSQLKGIPIVYEVLSPIYYITDFPDAVRNIANQRGIVAVNRYPEAFNQATATGISDDLIRVIPLFIDTERFKPALDSSIRDSLGISSSTIVLMTVCRLEREKTKSIYQLINSVRKWNSKYNVALLVVGDGSVREELENESNDLTNVHFLGTRTDLEIVLQNCDIFIGMGLSALEAAGCRKPVILSNIEATSFKDSSIGYFGEDSYGSVGGRYPEGELKSVSDLVTELIENVDKRNHWAETAYGIIQSNHTYQKVMNEWEEYYKNLTV